MRFISLTTSFKRFICVSIIFFSFVVSVQAQGTDPVISSFSPLTGDAGETVIITGNNFNTTASNNIVFFGATKAIVSSATATSLTMAVPAGATYGSLTLVDLSVNKSISSKKFFTPTYSPSKGALTAADFSTEQEFSTGETEPSKIAATGDLDGDGKPDIIIADGSGTNTMLILRNTGGSGTASFETALTMNTGGYNISLAVGDIDADGKLDIVEVNYNNNSDVKVYLNTTIAVGSISFADPINLPTGAAQYKLRNVAISDLDGDGKADLAVVDNSGSVLLFRNTGSVGVVGFDTKVVLDAGTGPQGIRIGDIDSDGLADLAITNADGGGTSVRVLRNTSTSGSFSFVNSGNFTTGGGPYDLALGDLDGDGELDIATVNHSGQNVSVLLNTSTSGAVSFANKTDFAIGKSTLKIAIGDLNGDGKLDVVVTQSGAAVFILMNTTTTLGTVTFDPKIDIASTGTSLQAMILDLDGDGKTDFATGGSKKIVVFSNADPLENADLGALSISETTLSQTFTPTNIAYSATVSNAITSITVTPTQTQSNETATIQVSVNAGSYSGVTSAAASGDLALNVGANTIDVKVTSPDGTTIKNYGITVTRELPVPSYVVSGAGTAAVNGVYVHIGKNSNGKELWQYSSYYLSSDGYAAWIGNDPNSMRMGAQYYDRNAYNKPSPLDWNMSSYYGSSPIPIIELAAPKVTYASSTLMEESTNNGAITGTTTITHNNYESATFTGTDSEDFVASGKAVVTGVPTGLTAVITRDNNLQLTFSLTGNANAHANANDISNLTIIFQDAAFSDSDAVNTTNFSTNLSINFIEQINVGSGETYTTIQSAVNAAGNGDVLLLAAETFTEQHIAIANKSLTIVGVSPASTIVQAHAVAGSATDRVFNITHSSYAETNFNSFEKLTIRHGNVARKAGGLYGQNTTLRLKDCSIESNNTTTPVDAGYYGDGGGGIQLENSNLISENCTFYDNHHISSYKSDMMGGGAIAFFPNDQVNYMEITNCTFSGNSSGAHGGAIMNRPTVTNDISITNSTFVGNFAPYGGAYMQMGSSANPQPIYLTNSLFYGNTATLGGSQMYSEQTTNWTVDNCLIEDTSAGGLAGVYTDCIVGQDPLLGTLTDNGGFTKTISIGAGSPAINSGTTTSLLLDQRGFSIVGNRDIGAYESGGAMPLSSNAELSDLTTTAGVLSPTFAKGTIAYTTANVNSSITSITVTPTQSDANATIEVQANGSGYATVTTATASSALALSVGANTVDVKVTAADGLASKTYTITITVTNTPPTFTSTAVTSVNQGDTYSYAITTNDVDGNAVSVTATTKPSWLTITPTGVVSTFAGSISGFVNGPINTASFTSVVSAAIDASGNMYVADLNNNVIRKINSDGVVSTFAGSGSFSYADGTGTAASFNNLERIAVDLSGNVYVTDRNNHKIRKITPAGVVTTLAGSSGGSANGSGTAAQFSSPKGIAVDNSGNVYVADTNNHRIRKITPAGAVTTLAGSSYGDSDGTGTGAQFQSPQDVAVDGSGNVYVADTNNSKVKKITPAGVVTTLAGSTVGYLDGTGTAAMFAYPKGIEVDGAGNIYLADTNNYRIRKITPTGVVTTFAGRTITVTDPMMGGDYETGGFEDGNTADALFNRPNDITIDASGNLYVADIYNYKIRKIITTGVILSGGTTGQVGDHNVVLDATDGNGGTVQQPFTISVKSAPIVSTTAASTIAQTSATLAGDATSDGGDAITERGYVYAVTTTNSNPLISGTGVTKVTDGTGTGVFSKSITGLAISTGYSFKAYATNSVGTTYGSVQIFTTINTPPTFTSTATTSVNEGDTYSYAITTNDVDGDAVSVTATTKPSWLTINSDVEVSTFSGSSQGFSDGTGTAAQFWNPQGIAIDPSGNVYVVDTDSHKIRKITPAGVVSTFAGSSYGFADGTGTAAQFQTPYGIAVDASGNVYVADTGNQKIRKITPAGVVSTFAGSSFGFADGTGTAAQFKNPYGVAVDASGNVYVADNSNHIIRKITPAGVVSTFAGSSYGFADGTATAAKFYNPRGVAVDASGNVYVADYGNRKIRKITPAGVVSTLAGSTAGDVDGTGTSVQFSSPGGITVDTSGNVYVADSGNHKIRKITPAGVVSTLAGSFTVVQDDMMGMSYNEGGYIDGNTADALFNRPNDITIDASGNLYVADTYNHKIRKITASSILSGDTTGQVGDHNVVLDATDGNGGTVSQSFTIDIVSKPTVTASAASTITASGAALNSNVTANGGATVTERGFVYAETSNDGTPTLAEVNGTTVIKEIVTGTTGAFTKVLTGLSGNTGFSYVSYAINSIGTTESSIETFTTINTPPTFTSTAITSVNEGDVYTYSITTNDIDGDAVSVTATTKPSWLTINTNVQVSTFAGSSIGFADGTGTSAQFNFPANVALDASGNMYVADYGNNKIRKITPAGVVSTFAGSSTGFADGTGTAAQFKNPNGIAVDASGNVYVADTYNHKIRKITPAGVVSTFAGASEGFAEGTGTAAQFRYPQGVAVDASGNVYVADTGNHKIRKITPTGVVTTFAGSDYGDVDGTGTSAQFKSPFGIAVDASGNVYVAGPYSHKIRKITPAGVVSTFAGSSYGFADGTGTAAQFKNPNGIAIDASGNLYVADRSNHKIRKITSVGVVSTLAGSSASFADGDGTTAQFNYPSGVAVDASGNVYVADRSNHKIRKIIIINSILSGDTTGQVGDHNVVLDANDGNGGTVSQSFTIDIAVPVLSKNGEISFTNPNYVNKNGALNSIFGLSATGAVIAVKDPLTPAIVGDLRDGGIVFWVDPTDNTHGLVCALSDYPNRVEWGCHMTDLSSVPNVAWNGGNPLGPGAEIGDGEPNTTGILVDCPSEAALAASSYGSEWFLPSAKELNEMYVNRVILEAATGFDAFSDDYRYWSSTECSTDFSINLAWYTDFSDGRQGATNKFNTFIVRAVRAF